MAEGGVAVGSDLTNLITGLETQTWEALKQSGQALIPFLDQNCIMVFPGSTIFSASSDPPLRDILEHPDMKPWLEYRISDVHVLPLGHDAASISYSVKASRGEGQEFRGLISSVWKKVGDSWKLCLHQQTPK